MEGKIRLPFSSFPEVVLVFFFGNDGHGIFSFFLRKLKKLRFFFSFLPLASNSEAKDPESEAAEYDSSSTVGGLNELVDALVLKVSDFTGGGLVMEATLLELLLWGNGGLLVKTVVPIEVTCEIWVSDTDEAIIGAAIETFWVDEDVVVTTAEAMTAILEEASWL